MKIKLDVPIKYKGRRREIGEVVNVPKNLTSAVLQYGTEVVDNSKTAKPQSTKKEGER